MTKVMPDLYYGVTSNYLTVQVSSRASQGDLVRIRLTGMEGTALQGECLD